MTADFAGADDELARRERDKYRRLWQRPDYRVSSPGEACVERAVALLGLEPGDSITDFGCGTGRACARLQCHGLVVRAIDHAENCLDPDVRVPLETACLWRLPRRAVTDYGFCTDVMEHIPLHRVDDALARIAGRVRRAVFFRISTVPDACGRLIGERLHLTVRPAGWWVERVGKAFHAAQWRCDATEVEIVAFSASKIRTDMREP